MPAQPMPEAHIIHGVGHATTASIEAESIGWIALGEGAHLYVDDENATEVLVALAGDAVLAGDVVLLVG